KIAEVSKADFESALRLLPEKHPGWERKVLLASALEGAGIREVWDNIEAFATAMHRSGEWAEQRREQLRHLLHAIAEERLKREFYNMPQVKAATAQVERQVLAGQLSPFSGAIELLKAFKRSD
ncbi:MAG: methylmalonyl Co-A mutase-associated GTPase MeaB, partial [Chlorobaculum sp.]|nr:methylmalonyl Co-A mutase-associated GTPase MeaB [Chlorobaculum sp.]